jgi:hypothetical protein
MAESEARETQSWIESAVECEYITKEVGGELFQQHHRQARRNIEIISRFLVPSPPLVGASTKPLER